MPKTKGGRILAAAAFIGGSIAAISAGWNALRLPVPALASDIQRLDRAQAETAIEVYQNKYRTLLLQPKPENPAAERAWEIELDRTLKKLDRAEDRLIDLSK